MIHVAYEPFIYPESDTTLPEDRFFVDLDSNNGHAVVRCEQCDSRVCYIDDQDDLNTLVRLSAMHLSTCGEVRE